MPLQKPDEINKILSSLAKEGHIVGRRLKGETLMFLEEVEKRVLSLIEEDIGV